MIINNKSIVPGILVKTKKGLGNYSNYINHSDRDNSEDSEDRFYILTEIKTDDGHCDEDLLVFYGLFEERFFHRNRWLIEKYIRNGFIDIVA